MSTTRRTPEAGTRALVAQIGAARVQVLLSRLVTGRVSAAAMVAPPYAAVIRCIGHCDVAAFLRDGTAEHLAYGPRSWAARSLAHLGDEDAATHLVAAFADPQWRVRMAAARARRSADRALARVEKRITPRAR